MDIFCILGSLLWIFSLCDSQQHHTTIFIPKRVEEHTSKGALYRSITLSKDQRFGYAGGKATITKISLQGPIQEEGRVTAGVDINQKPNFNDLSTNKSWWTAVSSDSSEFKQYKPIRDLLQEHNRADDDSVWTDLNLRKKLRDYTYIFTYGRNDAQKGNSVIDTVQQYSSIYQSEISFREHCIRQATALELYYGNALQIQVKDKEALCDIHIKGVELMENGQIFALHSGVFGTMPMAATGTNRYEEWVRLEAELYPFLFSCVLYPTGKKCGPLHTNSPYSPNQYNGIITDPPELSNQETLPNRNQYLMPSPENYIGKVRHCDYSSAPNRLIVTEAMRVLFSENLHGDGNKEPCMQGSLAQLFLSGYHPDQQTMSYYSELGNGPANQAAVYIITEIGSEKQLDLMVNYLNLPEIFPLTSSASLAMVRMLIETNGDVDQNSILVTNPFKYTWVTSPLNRFGRIDKTTSNEQVPYIPKPVGIYESNSYVYFFFREADWENTPSSPYTIQREHFDLTGYSRSMTHPWENEFMEASYLKYNESSPGQQPTTNEEVYNSPRLGWKYKVENLKVTGRVARVCKNDKGIPMGVIDPNLYDLDFKLSLNTFQSYLKARLVCRVPAAGVPFVWRLRRDEYRVEDKGSCQTEMLKAENLYSKDYHARQVKRDEYVTEKYSRGGELVYYYASTCKGYKWSYVPKMKMHSALYVEYNELRDFYVDEDIFYGVFSSSFASEHWHSSKHTMNSVKPTPSTALCSFRLKDIEDVFNGPLKKMTKHEQGYRPHNPKQERLAASIYECEEDNSITDFISNVQNMTIDFLDPTLPFDRETKNFDGRLVSDSLKYLDEDVYGSRTMWNNVETTPMFSESGLFFEKITGHQVHNLHVFYAATNEGSIYKISSKTKESKCFITKGANFTEWLNRTHSMSSIWDNEFYAYFNRSLNQTTFKAAFKSDLTMEKNIKFPEDILFKSDWECSAPTETKLLAIFKPFGRRKTKIWDMKLAGNNLVLATDDKIIKVPIAQCEQYPSCNLCADDPHCGWNASSNHCQQFSEDLVSFTDTSTQSVCAQLHTNITLFVTESQVLQSMLPAEVMDDYVWMKNGTAVTYVSNRIMRSDDGSLIILNPHEGDQGLYELKHIDTGNIHIGYNLSMSDCQTEECRYKNQFNEWCDQYLKFIEEMEQWKDDYKSSGYCRNL